MFTSIVRLIIATLLLIIAFIIQLTLESKDVIKIMVSLIMILVSIVLFTTTSMRVRNSNTINYISVSNISIANISLIIQIIMVPPFLVLGLYHVITSKDIFATIFYLLSMLYLLYYQYKYFKSWRKMVLKIQSQQNKRSEED